MVNAQPDAEGYRACCPRPEFLPVLRNQFEDSRITDTTEVFYWRQWQKGSVQNLKEGPLSEWFVHQ